MGMHPHMPHETSPVEMPLPGLAKSHHNLSSSSVADELATAMHRATEMSRLHPPSGKFSGGGLISRLYKSTAVLAMSSMGQFACSRIARGQCGQKNGRSSNAPHRVSLPCTVRAIRGSNGNANGECLPIATAAPNDSDSEKKGLLTLYIVAPAVVFTTHTPAYATLCICEHCHVCVIRYPISTTYYLL